MYKHYKDIIINLLLCISSVFLFKHKNFKDEWNLPCLTNI